MEFINAHGVSYAPSTWLTFDDVLLMPQPSDLDSRNDPRLDLSSRFVNGLKIRTPIISANMDTVTGAEMVKAMASQGGYGILHRFYKTKEEFLEECKAVLNATKSVAISIGANKEDVNIVNDVLALASDKEQVIVCVDVAHGHLRKCSEQVRRLAKEFGGRVHIIAGNVCTPKGVVDLVNAGAGAIKVGVGSGSMCTTRVVTGHGIPQLSAIMQCRRAINSMQRNVALIADGGIRNSGDIIKALAAGADTVMLGNLFAGTLESEGLVYIKNDNENSTLDLHPIKSDDNQSLNNIQPNWYKKYRGQSSQDFMNDIGKTNVTAEGEHMYIPYRGSVIPILKDLIQGIKSGMTYSGVSNLEQLSEKAIFLEISSHSYIEGTPHGKR